MNKLLLCIVAFAFSGVVAPAQTVRFETNAGNIDVTLLPASAPRTVQNFLAYLNRGAYDNSFFHRSVRSFIIQGGGFKLQGTTAVAVEELPAVVNEYRVSNRRGTIAMAKLDGNPNSATNQWFFNLRDNNANILNPQNGGFTVFGMVANDASFAVMDKIADLPIFNQSATKADFSEIPLQNYTSGNFLNETNLVLVKSIKIVEPDPAISSGGVVSVSAFGGFASAASGSFVEIYGTSLAGTSRGWAGSDFNSGRAPSELDGVSVTIDGKPAFVNYVSPRQVNIQVPADIAASGAVAVVVTNNGRSTAPAMLTIKPTAGGLYAPPLFRLNDRQFVAAIHAASGAYVTNGNISDFPKAPAVPGETLTFYGIGFGPVVSGEVAGQVASGVSEVRNAVEFRFGDVPARVTYAGLVPNAVGLYQFNVVVPEGVGSGDVALRVSSGGEAITQTLYISVDTPAR